jgi:hypothetical protein
MEWILGAIVAIAVVALVVWLLLPRPHLGHSSRVAQSPYARETGYSVWAYEKGGWKILEDKSAVGFVPGRRPDGSGAHEGYCVKVDSVPVVEVR